jgi:hypothetical protein
MMIMGPDTYRKKGDKRQRYIPLAWWRILTMNYQNYSSSVQKLTHPLNKHITHQKAKGEARSWCDAMK